MPKPVKPPRVTPPITGTAAQKDAARDARLANLKERVARLESLDDVATARAKALRA